jgi:FkbM family methyltransferase
MRLLRTLFSKPPRGASRHPIGFAISEITAKPGFVVVQLGAYIGKSENDPLYHTLVRQLQNVGGTLILVEPVKQYFEALVKNYAGVPGVVFENCAIADRSGTAELYRLDVDPVAHGFPEWLSQLSSLKEERMTDLWDRYESDQEMKKFYLKHRVQETVRCITFQELLRRNQIEKVDLLQIDVEGYELEILRTIDFRSVPVRFVNYECVLLQNEKPRAEKLMRKWGYRHVDFFQDTFCYKRADAHLAHLWT